LWRRPSRAASRVPAVETKMMEARMPRMVMVMRISTRVKALESLHLDFSFRPRLTRERERVKKLREFHIELTI
ncbi:MAG: hypothetical protein WCX77_00290, partial [Candidatus Paceibacterota bacterium]